MYFDQFCPDTKEKYCIGSECPAFGYSRPSLWKCEVCGDEVQTGSTCSSSDHKRVPVYFKDFPYCKKYSVGIE